MIQLALRRVARKGSPRNSIGRLVLPSLLLSLVGAPAFGSGCASGLAPVSRISGLRVLAVTADKPYAKPGDTVNFTMTTVDTKGPRPLQIAWFAGCYDPVGDEYYACYGPLAEAFASAATGAPSPLVGSGTTFSLTLPGDLISRRPAPTDNTAYYGIAYVFFAACAGTLKPVAPSGSGAAGSFPLGCFDSENNELGADSFVPGYTQVYAFADRRTNKNPDTDGLTIRGDVYKDGVNLVEACSMPEDARLLNAGCGHEDPFQTCHTYAIDVSVPEDIAEVDPGTTSADGKPLREAVWVDYFAEKGDFQTPTLLISDAVTGLTSNHSSNYIAPPESGDVQIWAVLHDSRGGTTVTTGFITVK